MVTTTNIFIRLLFVGLYHIICPLKALKTDAHIFRNNHQVTVRVINFNYDVECIECGEVFCSEIE